MCAGCSPMYCPAAVEALTFTLTLIFTRPSPQASLSLSTQSPTLDPKPHLHRQAPHHPHHHHHHQAIFDAILVPIVNIVSPSGKWQQLQQQMCDPPHRKHMIPHGCSPECIRLQPGARTVAGATRSTARRTPTHSRSSTARTATLMYSSCRHTAYIEYCAIHCTRCVRMQHIARTHTRRACAGGGGSLRGQGQCRIARPELRCGLLLVTRRQARLDLNPNAKPKPNPSH